MCACVYKYTHTYNAHIHMIRALHFDWFKKFDKSVQENVTYHRLYTGVITDEMHNTGDVRL